MNTKRPYKAPESRTIKDWCDNLGLTPYPVPKNINMVLSYDDFCFLPNIKLRKEYEGELYNFWRKNGDVWGECRTVEEWLQDFKWEIIEPTKDDFKDMNLFLGHDEFWDWSSGRINYKKSSLWDNFKAMIGKMKN